MLDSIFQKSIHIYLLVKILYIIKTLIKCQKKNIFFLFSLLFSLFFDYITILFQGTKNVFDKSIHSIPIYIFPKTFNFKTRIKLIRQKEFDIPLNRHSCALEICVNKKILKKYFVIVSVLPRRVLSRMSNPPRQHSIIEYNKLLFNLILHSSLI